MTGQLFRKAFIGLLLFSFSIAGPDAFAFLRPTAGGSIHVTTEPEGAAVTCNGVLQALSPVTISELKAGEYLIEVERNGYRPQRRTVVLLDQQKAALDFRLEPLHGLLLVHSEPPDAEVQINGAWRGRTPLLLTDVPLGSHKVDFRAEGHLPRTLDLTVSDRIPQKIEVELVSDAATIVARSTPSGASVLLNGSLRGETPLEVPRVSSGDYELELRLHGYRSYREKIVLNPGDRHLVEVELDAVPATLEVVSNPEGAWVYVDNQRRGRSPLELPALDPGSYRVRVELQGYEPSARDVQLAPADNVVEEFRLTRNSGTIELVTEPAGVKVYLNGEYIGMSQAAEADTVSKPMVIEYVAHHTTQTLQLTREGYSYTPKEISLKPNEVLTLHETLIRRFIVDTIVVRDTAGARQELRGQLLVRHPNGDVELGISRTMTMYIPEAEILSINPIREE